jgi:glycine cleavage system aminomethyltransferase T
MDIAIFPKEIVIPAKAGIHEHEAVRMNVAISDISTISGNAIVHGFPPSRE